MTLDTTDLLGLGAGLQLHCMTAEDNLTCVALCSNNYNKTFGKKFCSECILEFRDYFSFDHTMYLDLE